MSEAILSPITFFTPLSADAVGLYNIIQIAATPLKQTEERKFKAILSDPRLDTNQIASDTTALKKGMELISNEYGEATALAFGSFIASGLNRSQMLDSVREIDKLFKTVASKLPRALLSGFPVTHSKVELANLIFKLLTAIEPERYMFEYAPMPEALKYYNDGDPQTQVGNCLDLTIIDNIILNKFGFQTSAATNEETATGAFHHVHPRLKINGIPYDLNVYNGSTLQPADISKKEIKNIALIAMIYTVRGKAEEKLGNYKEAKLLYTKSLELFPNYLSAYECRAFVNLQLGLYDEAIEDASSALRINPDRYAALNSRAAARYMKAIGLGQEGRPAEAKQLLLLALADLNRAVDIEPYLPLAYTNRANVKWELGMKKEGDKDWETSQKLRLAP
jgi:tetratricopeptide (TPR) repeat protein